MVQSTDLILKAITAAIKEETTVRVDKAIKEAKQRVEKEIRASVDKIALSVLAEYDVSSQNNHIIIKVKKDV